MEVSRRRPKFKGAHLSNAPLSLFVLMANPPQAATRNEETISTRKIGDASKQCETDFYKLYSGPAQTRTPRSEKGTRCTFTHFLLER
jgi:hypothetical protein